MNNNSKRILLAAAAYVVTMFVAIFIIVFAIAIILQQSFNCSDMGRALSALWVTIALVCIGSLVAVVAATRRYAPDMTVRNPVLVAYGAVILASYGVLAFGLMILFNC